MAPSINKLSENFTSFALSFQCNCFFSVFKKLFLFLKTLLSHWSASLLQDKPRCLFVCSRSTRLYFCFFPLTEKLQAHALCETDYICSCTEYAYGISIRKIEVYSIFLILIVLMLVLVRFTLELLCLYLCPNLNTLNMAYSKLCESYHC